MKKFIKTDYGELCYVLTRKRVKNINFTIKPDGIIYISTGKNVPEAYIKACISAKSEKLVKHIKALEAKAEKAPDENAFYFLGRKYEKEIITANKKEARLDDKLIIYTPDPSLADKITEEFYRDMTSRIYTDTASEIWELLKGENLPQPLPVKIKTMKSRWGSCSPEKRSIVLNSRLIYYPIECLKYVILHEFAHLRYRNHDKSFYAFVEKYMKDYKTYVNMLKKQYYEVCHE